MLVNYTFSLIEGTSKFSYTLGWFDKTLVNYSFSSLLERKSQLHGLFIL